MSCCKFLTSQSFHMELLKQDETELGRNYVWEGEIYTWTNELNLPWSGASSGSKRTNNVMLLYMVWIASSRNMSCVVILDEIIYCLVRVMKKRNYFSTKNGTWKTSKKNAKFSIYIVKSVSVSHIHCTTCVSHYTSMYCHIQKKNIEFNQFNLKIWRFTPYVT